MLVINATSRLALPEETVLWDQQVSPPVPTSVQPTAVPSGYTLETRLVAYTCIVTPVDHDNDEATATIPTRRRWSGQFVITPKPTPTPVPPAVSTPWVLGTASGQFKLCRYTGDYVPGNTLSNSEHPLYYRGVTGALDHQNYVVIQGDANCPYDGPSVTATGNYINSNTTLHQNASTGSDPFGGRFSGDNAGSPKADYNGGLNAVEPDKTPIVEFPML
jgi:hypothetical protein